MFRLTIALFITMLWSMAPLAICQTDEFVEPSREWWFEEAKRIIRSHPEILRLEHVHDGLWEALRFMGQETGGPVTDSMRIFLEEIVAQPANHRGLRDAALGSLRLFKNEQQVERMQRYLSDPDLQVTAATILVEWGYWDEGSPVLIENEVWWPLVQNDSARAEPILRKAVETASPCWKINAAGHLTRYGDSLTQVEVARAILQKYVVQQEAYSDTMNLRCGVGDAYELLVSRGNSDDIPLMEAGLQHTVQGIRGSAGLALFHRAWAGDERALLILRSAAQSSDYQDVKDAAKYDLRNVGNKREP